MIDYDTCRSLPAMFCEIAAPRGERPFLWAKQHRKYQSLSWAETARTVNRLARSSSDGSRARARNCCVVMPAIVINRRALRGEQFGGVRRFFSKYLGSV